MTQGSVAKTLLVSLKARLPRMLEILRELTRLESPSTEKSPADRCCGFLADQWLLRGGIIDVLKQQHRGNHLRVHWPTTSKRASGQFLVLGHYDTVYPTGTLASMPFRISGGKAFGPGTFDMKAGIVQALFAFEALQELKIPVTKNIVFLWTSDEEIGSGCSRAVIETEAKRSEAVFVLEPSLGPGGLLKTSRKGVGQAELVVHGRSSHAGLEPEKGINAVHELAAQIARIERWNNLRRGVTINADIVEGGSRVNVIPDRAKANLDLRAWRASDMHALESRLHSLKPIHRGARLEITGGFERPPLERKFSAALFTRAKALAQEAGLSLGEAAAGGGSDGNFTAALGIPTLDGLGAVGGGAHSRDEHVIVKTMPQRAALLAALLASS
ncbi:MAG TPA: M20 family metallopeptidase [Candidatus Eremiobacteraceae bacterium]|nr:M20 family metallopeptidase [Candidatus Eremiobacteraceae bacterium]